MGVRCAVMTNPGCNLFVVRGAMVVIHKVNDVDSQILSKGCSAVLIFIVSCFRIVQIV